MLTMPLQVLAAVIPFDVLFLVSTLVAGAWPIAWLRTQSATPGKLILRLRVQPAAAPGRLTWSAVLARVAVQVVVPNVAFWFALEATDSSPTDIIGALLGLSLLGWVLLDCLTALGNPRRRAIHDWAAEAVVVQQVRPPAPFPGPLPGGAMPNMPPQQPRNPAP